METLDRTISQLKEASSKLAVAEARCSDARSELLGFRTKMCLEYNLSYESSDTEILNYLQEKKDSVEKELDQLLDTLNERMNSVQDAN